MRICLWPERPACPAAGEACVLRLAAPRTRAVARVEARAVLRELLAAWTGLPPDRLPLAETSRGPVWLGEFAGGGTLAISLAYGAGEAWIGLRRGGAVGVDVLAAAPFPEADAVARLYLGPAVAEDIRRAADPVTAFAVAWTAHEAVLKCCGRDLEEWTPQRPPAGATVETVMSAPGRIGAVAIG